MPWYRFHATCVSQHGVYIVGIAYDLPAPVADSLKSFCRPCPPPWDAQADPAAVARNDLRRLQLLRDIESLRRRAESLASYRAELTAARDKAEAARIAAEKATDRLQDALHPDLHRRYWESEIVRGEAIRCEAELALTNLDISDLADELAGIDTALQSEGTPDGPAATDEPTAATDEPTAATDEPQPTSHEPQADGPHVRSRPSPTKGRPRKARRP